MEQGSTGYSEIVASFHNVFTEKLSKRESSYSNSVKKLCKAGSRDLEGISESWPRKASTQLAETYCLYQSIFGTRLSSPRTYHSMSAPFIFFFFSLTMSNVLEATRALLIARRTSSISRRYEKVHEQKGGRKRNVCGRRPTRKRRPRDQKVIRSQR